MAVDNPTNRKNKFLIYFFFFSITVSVAVIVCSVQFSSVQMKMVSIRSEKPRCTPPCLSEVFPTFNFETAPMFV